MSSIEAKSCFTDETDIINPETTNSYCLLLIPTVNEKLPNFIIQQKAEDLCKEIASVTVLVHSMEEVNQAVQNGNSFFINIYKRGFLLHDRDEQAFAVPGEDLPINKHTIKREKYWNKFHNLSVNFLKGAQFYVNEQIYPLAIFMLHQAVMHSYSGTLKVLTGYKSSSNSLSRLIRLINNTLPDSVFVLPKNTAEEARLTSLLLKGYSDARYHDKFKVTPEEVNKLISHIGFIVKTANEICQTRLNHLKTGKIIDKT